MSPLSHIKNGRYPAPLDISARMDVSRDRGLSNREIVTGLSALSIVVALMILVQGCTSAGAPLTVLGTPRFVPQSQPDSTAETGIGQDPATGGMFLQWYSAVGAEGYKVYRTDTTNGSGIPIQFSPVADLNKRSVLIDTTTVDRNDIVVGVRYYYYLTAYASDGSHSSPSDTINYKLLSRPSLAHPGPSQTLPIAGLYFSWEDRTGGGYTVIRVRDKTVIPPEYVWVSRRTQIYGGTLSVEHFNFDSTATHQLVPGHSYEWRVDRFDLDGKGRPYEGSRSPWSTFTVN